MTIRGVSWLVLACAIMFGFVRAGETKPRHQQIELGPFVSYTLEAQWPRNNLAYKGIAIRLKHAGKDSAAYLFDTDLLRAGAMWAGGFVNFEKDVATIRDFRSVVPVGTQIGGMPQLPGAGATKDWSATGFTDPRTSLFGPVPKTWGRYKGLYLNGDKVVLSYEIAGRSILELPAYESFHDIGLLTRTFTIAASDTPITVVLNDRLDSVAEMKDGTVVFKRVEGGVENAADKAFVEMDRVEDNWERLKMGGPSRADSLSKTKTAKIVALKAASDKPGKHLAKLADGTPAMQHDDPERVESVDGNGFFLVDLSAEKALRQIDTFSWQTHVRSPQIYRVFGASGPTAPEISAQPATPWTEIAAVNTESLGAGGLHGVSIHKRGAALGTFRWLLFQTQAPSKQNEGTYFCEFDVFSMDDEPKFPDRRIPEDQRTLVAFVNGAEGVKLRGERGCAVLEIGASKEPRTVKVAYWQGAEADVGEMIGAMPFWPKGQDLTDLTKGGAKRWAETLETKGKLGADDKAYTVDTITMPEANPWNAWFRPGGFDFFADGSRAAVSNWNGDVWAVSGIDSTLEKLTWQRIATGLFHPLGLKIVNDQVYVLGRDQITKLVDLNGDGETDFYENFNNDVEVTWNFHEFAFDLQTDAEGHFYFAKGAPVRAGGRGFERIAAHHGTVLKVSKDGSKLERFATGLRAPNGMAIGPEGQVTTGENEGTWVPSCRLNWLKAGGFGGVVDTAHRETKPADYDQPLCWLPREIDNSGGGQAWVTSDKWGPFKGDLLHLSYGTCSLYKVLHETVNGVTQGGVVRIPVQFDAGILRARFNPRDGQLYVCGLKGWQTTANRDGCFQRVRFTGKAVNMPAKLSVGKDSLTIAFTDALQKDDVSPDAFAIEQWNYLWSEAYGSADYSVANPAEKKHDVVNVSAATLSADGKSVTLSIPGLKPVMQMKIKLRLTGADGSKIAFDIANSVHVVPEK